jgi:hypothetical protein
MVDRKPVQVAHPDHTLRSLSPQDILKRQHLIFFVGKSPALGADQRGRSRASSDRFAPDRSRLLGRAPCDWSPPHFDLAAFALPRRLPASIPSEFVHQRPDIHAAEAQLHSASAIGIATRNFIPLLRFRLESADRSRMQATFSVRQGWYGVLPPDSPSRSLMAA